MGDTFHRLLRLLQLVPRHPKWIDTDQLVKNLTSEGIDATLRTIQRDLVKLERMPFGLVCIDDKNKPYKWQFAESAESMLLPGLDPQAALALRLVELHLERMLPKASVRAIQPHLQAAKRSLEGKPVARWLDKVRLIPRSQPLMPPQVDGGVTGVVHEALLEGKQLKAIYRARGKDAREMTLHPLGLVHRDSVAYLVCTVFDYDDFRMLALHRFDDAKMLDQKVKPQPKFNLDEFIEKGELSYKLGADDVDVELLMDNDAAVSIEETPLASNQQIVKHDDKRMRVTARVPDTQVLRSWLLGFGPKVEVVKPASLREAIAEAHRTAAARYP